MWWRDNWRGAGQILPFLGDLWAWLKSMALGGKLLAYLLSAGALIVTIASSRDLTSRDLSSRDLSWRDLSWRDGSAAGEGNLTHTTTTTASSAADLGADLGESFSALERGVGDEGLWLVYSVANFLILSFFMQAIMVPFRQLSLLMISVRYVLQNDMMIFLTILLVNAFKMWSTLFLIYPAAGGWDFSLAPVFNDLSTSLWAMFDMIFLGTKISVDYSSFAVGEDHPLQEIRDPLMVFEMVAFLMAYVYTVLLLLFLMLKLLVGMMGTTYAAVQRSALLQWRHLFCARILQLELVYPWTDRTFVGCPAQGTPGTMVKEVLQVKEFIDPAKTPTVLKGVVESLPVSSPLADDLQSLYITSPRWKPTLTNHMMQSTVQLTDTGPPTESPSAADAQNEWMMTSTTSPKSIHLRVDEHARQADEDAKRTEDFMLSAD